MNRPPRESATVLLLRESPAGPEVFMVRRHINSDFVGGAYVFPGGALDAADLAPATQARMAALSAEAADALVLPPEKALGHWSAAIRETFEEAGVLLANRAGRPLAMDTPESQAHWAAKRAQLLGGDLDWGRLLEEEGLVLACDRLRYFAHWITPEGVHKRFTTRFYAALAPADQTPLPDAREVDRGEWLTPARALERQKLGEITLILPTRKTLEAVAGFGSAAAFLDDCGCRPVPAILPRVGERDGQPVVLLPGEPGYDLATPPAGAFDPSRA